MAKHRILIVDDQRDTRRLFRVGLESLGPEYHVVDVPSGEEAILELSRGLVDLLVTDVRLAGISGLELIKKIRRRHPDLKVILVTGLTDPDVKREVADAGVDAFFYKPVEISDFQDAVERCLGVVDAAAPVPLEPPKTEKKEGSGSLADHLADLRQDLDAVTAVLLDERGRIMAQAGELPAVTAEAMLIPPIMATFSASEKISQSLGMKSPDDLMYFRGVDHNLFVAHVGPSLGLLLVTEANGHFKNGNQAAVITRMQSAASGLLGVLTELGVPVEAQGKVPLAPDLETVAEDTEEFPSELEDIFHQAARIQFNARDVDAFWDSLAEQADSGGVANADALSYEQARRLGLTPRGGA